MKFVKKDNLKQINLPGRIIQKAVGKEGAIKSKKMTVGFARYSAESGPMEPHHHAAETVYIVGAKNGWVCYGSKKDKMEKRVEVEPGMILYFDELEWHVFEYNEGGYVDIIYIYGQVDNIRPEDIE